tara:strand:- start:157828 stop:158448 length:621 start_codon:yes stop_codon:yes gene_type:complete
LTKERLDRARISLEAARLAKRDPALASVYDRLGPPPYWQRPATFATFIRIILEQQVALKAAWSTYNQLQQACEGRVSPPKIMALGESGLRQLGFSRQKARYSNALAENVESKTFRIGSLRHQDDEEARRRIVAQLGLGNWSADIFLLMALRRTDIFPVGDLAIVKGISQLDNRQYTSTDEIIRRAESWRPFRSVATRMIWQFYLNR